MERSPSKIKFSSISVYSLSCLFFFFFFFLRLQSISSSDGADGETSNKLNKPPIEGLSFLCGVCSGSKIGAETICWRLFSTISIPAFPKCFSNSEIAEKEERAREVDRENTDSIKSGIANFFGKGKYAAIEQENERLKAENEHIKESFPDAVRKEVAKRTKALTEAKRAVELERDSAMAIADSFESERDTALRQLREQKTGEQHRISMAVSRATAEKDKTIRLLQSALKASRHILSLFADMLYKANEVFRRAIDAIIHFGTEQHKSVFSPSEAADIKSVMQEYGETPEQHSAVGAWLCDYAESRQPFDEIKHRHTLKEVGDVAEGKYDWKINSTQSNGLSR